MNDIVLASQIKYDIECLDSYSEIVDKTMCIYKFIKYEIKIKNKQFNEIFNKLLSSFDDYYHCFVELVLKSLINMKTKNSFYNVEMFKNILTHVEKIIKYKKHVYLNIYIFKIDIRVDREFENKIFENYKNDLSLLTNL